MYGIYVDNDLVLVVPDKLKRGMGDEVWFKVRDAVWSKFSCYDRPDCNPLFERGYTSHSGKKIFIEKLPT